MHRMSPLENMCPTTISTTSSRLESRSSTGFITIESTQSSSTMTSDDSTNSMSNTGTGSELPTKLSCPRLPVVSSNEQQQQQQPQMSRFSSLIQNKSSSSQNPIRVVSGSNVQKKGILPLMKKVSSNVMKQVCDIDERVCIYCQIRGKMIEDWKNGDRICTNCGIVDEEKISDMTPEWRDYDNDDRAGSNGGNGDSNARCGLQITDESKYWGGLQPTTVSKYIYGGVVTSSNTKRTSSYDTGTALRKSVSMANYRVHYNIEQIQKQQLLDAKLSYKLRQKLIQTTEKNKDRTKRRNSSSKRKRRRQDNDDDCLDDEYGRHHDDGNDGNENDNDSDSDTSCYVNNNDDIVDTSRPELEYLVVEEEEDAYKLQIALNSDKWSLDRAIHLYGDSNNTTNPTKSTVLSFNEVFDFDDSTDNNNTNNNNNKNLLVDKNGNYTQVTGKVKKINKELRTASYELYIVYTILLSSSVVLQLPTTVTNEAIALLCKYIQYHDGIIVRGISTTTTNTSTSTSTKSTTVSTSSNKILDKQQQQQQQKPVSLKRTTGSINSKNSKNPRTKRIVLNHHHNQRCLKRKLANCSSSHQVVDDTGSTNVVKNDNNIQQNRILYKEYNLLKQMGSLCSGILYLISRSMQYPRTIDEVCKSITIPESFIEKYKKIIQQEQQEREEVSQEQAATSTETTSTTSTSFITRKHCSRAMNQIKACFPDFARIATSGSHTIILNQNNNNNSNNSNNKEMIAVIPTTDAATTTTTTIDNYDSVCNFIEHTIRKLLLPPVAQASIRCLVYLCRNRSTSVTNENNIKNNNNPFTSINTEHFASTKLPTVCAAITYFICIVGTTMRTLALQAEVDAAKEKKRKAGIAVVPTISSLSLSATAKSSSSSSSNTVFDWKSKYSAVSVSTKQQQTKQKQHDVTIVADAVPSVLEEHHQQQQQQQQQQHQPQKQEEQQHQAFDVFATNVDITTIDAEHRAYEMRRMWDAWVEQMEWNRTVVEIEKITNVSQKIIRDYCKQHIYPIRQQLLEILRMSVVDFDTVSRSVNNAKDVVDSDSEYGLFPEQIELKDTPLASLLLSHITIATSMIKSK